MGGRCGVRYGGGDRDHRDTEKIRESEGEYREEVSEDKRERGGVQKRGQCECNGAGLSSQQVGNLEHQKSHACRPV